MKGTLQSRQVKTGTQREMVEMGAHLEPLQLDESAKRTEQVVGLRHLGAGRGLLKRGILFERLVVLLDPPPSLVKARYLLEAKRQVARNQIQGNFAAIFVLEELLDQQKREVHLLQVDLHYFTRLQTERLDCLIDALALILFAQRHQSVTLDGHYELTLQLPLDQPHVVSRGKPHIIEDIAERYLVGHACQKQSAIVLILADTAPASLFAALLVDVFLGFGNKGKIGFGNKGKSGGKGHFNLFVSRCCLHLIQSGEEVDPFDQTIFAVVIMPADQVVFVGIGLFLYAVVYCLR
jgi:hypothetical protein